MSGPARPPLLTIGEAAARLAVHPRTFRGWLAAGKLPHVRLGARAVRIDPADLEDFIERSRQPAERGRP